MLLKPLIAQRAFNTPLLMHPGKAAAAVSGIGDRLCGGGIDLVSQYPLVDHSAFESGRPSMGRLADRVGRIADARGVPVFDMIEGVAVIPVEGTLVHKGSYVGKSSGATSYEGLQAQIRRAGRRDDVRGVVFEVDSYGGEVAGAFETAAMIRELSAQKPTLAILTDFAYSAGYLLASQARQIVAPEFGGAGSIGVITMHVDYSKWLDNEGIKVTLLTAGARKADGNLFEALPDSVADKINERLATMRERFAEAVGLGRGARFTASQAMATEADDFRGEEAASLGLIDAVADPSETFDAFISALNGR